MFRRSQAKGAAQETAARKAENQRELRQSLETALQTITQSRSDPDPLRKVLADPVLDRRVEG